MNSSKSIGMDSLKKYSWAHGLILSCCLTVIAQISVVLLDFLFLAGEFKARSPMTSGFLGVFGPLWVLFRLKETNYLDSMKFLIPACLFNFGFHFALIECFDFSGSGSTVYMWLALILGTVLVGVERVARSMD
jgi:hypothetical protein